MRKSLIRYGLLASSLCLWGFAMAQSSITGKVLTDEGQPLSGALIIVKDANAGAYSDAQGGYTIALPAGRYVLHTTYLGYLEAKDTVLVQEGKVSNHTIVMAKDVNQLEGVVAIGYQTKIKRDITGNVASVSGKEINEIPVPSFEAGLQGRALGLEVVQGGGVAGSPSLVRIRGVASVSSSGDPLYIVDGVPVNQDYFTRGNQGAMNSNPLASINPLDIESIDVLKDAAATAIYGARGSNGVIIITTKRAKRPGWNTDVQVRLGSAAPTYLPTMLNSQQFLQMYQEAWENDGNVGRAKLPANVTWEQAENTNTDWVDELTRVGFKQLYSISSGYKGANWGAYMNLTHDNNESYLANNKYVRNSARMNLDWEPIKDLKINASTSFVQGTNYRVYNGWAGGLGAALSTALPIYSIYDSTGEYDLSHVNPVAVLDLLDWKTFETRSINSLNIEYPITNKLKIKAFAGLDYSRLTDDVHIPGQLLLVDHAGNANRDVNVNTTETYNLVGTYNILDHGMHQLSLLVGVERVQAGDAFQTFFEDSMSQAFYKNKAVRDTLTNRLSVGTAWALNSVFARVDYSLMDKYLLDVTFRTDGSSRFGPNKRYAYFPALGLGWILTQESFMNRLPFINFAKLKAGFGISGNVPSQNNVWRQIWFRTDNIQYNNQSLVFPTNHENPDLQWEPSEILDISLELEILKGRISTEVAYYNKTTRDLLLSLSTPASTGFASYWENTGAIRNYGFEFSMLSRNIVRPEFTWETRLSISRNLNKVLDLGVYFQDALGGGTNDTRVVVGQPLGTNYLVRFSHVDKATGRPVYLDKDGNETFTWSNDDRVAVGSVLPLAFGNFENNFRYKRFYLATNFVYKWGGNIYNSSAKRQNGVVTDWNMTTDYFDRWQQAGDEAKYPRLSMNTDWYGLPPDPYQYNTTLFLEDGSYLRLRSISLSYSVPEEYLGNRLRSLQLGIAASNLLTWTNFKGGDPEIARDFENPQDRNMSSSITYLTSPQEKSIMFNLNLSF